MDKGTKYFILSVAALTFGVFGFIFHQAWKSMNEAAMLSCLFSITDKMNKEITENRFKVDNQPRKLTQAEVEQLLKQISGYDCGSIDLSSEQIHVAVGDVNKTSPLIKIKVWTDGSDGIAGTDDDFVVPQGEKVY
jgi:hypothetical protein